MSERVVTNGWTGGQYSLFRVVFGIWLAARFATLLASPNSLAAPFLHSPTAGTIVLAVAALLAEGESVIRDAEAAAVSFPEFFDTLDSIAG